MTEKKRPTEGTDKEKKVSEATVEELKAELDKRKEEELSEEVSLNEEV